MVDRKVVLRYARALFALARDRDILETVKLDLEKIGRSFDESRELAAFLEDPRVPPARKRETANRWFGEQVGPLTLDFVDLVLARRREGLLLDVYKVFSELVRDAEGIVEAHVESAVELDGFTLDNLKAKLEEMTDKHVELTGSVAPELLGGLRIRVGNDLIDGSLRRRLDDLRKHLSETEVSA